jgi:hypothetical protein
MDDHDLARSPLIDARDLADPDPAALGRLERGCSPGPDYRRAGGVVFHAAPVDWPDPLHDDAYCGLAGEIVDSLLPFTEASPAAMLLQLLVLLGNVVGRGTWVGPAKRAWRTNEFVLVVGDSAYGRKGTALAEVQDLVAEAFPDWFHTSYRTSLATGEGLVHMMRDPDPRADDPGAPDRRCLVAETEFAKTMRRNTTNDTLSGNIRTAWDGLPLQVNTKTAPSQATDYHFSLVGHITPAEFHANLDSLDIANGLLNRFVICASWMSKTVNQVSATGAQLDSTRRARLIGRLQAAAQAAVGRGQVLFDNDAVKLYQAARPALLADNVGYVAAISRRAPDHLCRLALILSLIDIAPAVTADHVRAAWACWDYALRSTRYLFGDRLGDPIADQLWTAIRQHSEDHTEWSRDELSSLLGKNRLAADRDNAVALLVRAGRLHQTTRTAANGRTIPTWRAHSSA